MSEVTDAATEYSASHKAWQDANHAVFLAEVTLEHLRKEAFKADREMYIAGEKLKVLAVIRDA